MEQRAFGQPDLQLPVIGMGTWRTFDVRGQQLEAARRQVVDRAQEYGARVVDSSPMYGEAERVLGKALDGRRSQFFVATKVWTPDDHEAGRQVERALDYFGGTIDLYQVHNLVTWEKRLAMLEDLRERRKVRLIGVTSYRELDFGTLIEVMETGRVQAIQIPYNPLERAVERSVLPRARELGIGVLVMRPFAGGALVQQPPPAHELLAFEAFGVRTWAQALLKWGLSNPLVHVAIPATSRPERMVENAQAGNPPWLDEAARERVAFLAGRQTQAGVV